MSSRRLTDSDKQDIVELYRQPGQTSLTLAEQYGVSNTTISRILKTSLSPEEYESLIQQKRSARFNGDVVGQGSLLDVESYAGAEPTALADRLDDEPEAPTEAESEPEPKPVPRKVAAPVLRRSKPRQPEEEEAAAADDRETAQATTVEAILGEDLTPQSGGMMDDDDDEDLDDLDTALSGEFDDDDDDDEEGGAAMLPSIQLGSADLVRVLPLADASIPRTCYLVVDRSAELVARPLSEFAELGQIPSGEVEEKTLPVFDNHRVARRFSNIRTQRVIKVPDSRILRKASSHLQAKGITRLLIDGQIYAL